MVANNWSLVEIGATGKFSTERTTKRENTKLTFNRVQLVADHLLRHESCHLGARRSTPLETERPAIEIIHCETLFIEKEKRITIRNIVISILSYNSTINKIIIADLNVINRNNAFDEFLR